MAYLQQIFKELEKEKKRAQKELERLEEAVFAFGKVVGKRAGKAGRRAAVETEQTVQRVRRKLSAEARKRISQAQKARWAKFKGR